VREAEAAARQRGFKIVAVDVRSADQLGPALAAVTFAPGIGLTVLPDVFLVTLGTQIVQWAIRYGVPAIYAAREWGWTHFVRSESDRFVRWRAEYVVRILRGARAGDLPIEQPSTFELLVNMKSADAPAWPCPAMY